MSLSYNAFSDYNAATSGSSVADTSMESNSSTSMLVVPPVTGEEELEAFGDSDLAVVDMQRSPSRQLSFKKPRAPSVSSRRSRRSTRNRRGSSDESGSDTYLDIKQRSVSRSHSRNQNENDDSSPSPNRALNVAPEMTRTRSVRSTRSAVEEDVDQLERRVQSLEKKLTAANADKAEFETQADAWKKKYLELLNTVDSRKNHGDFQSMTIQELRELVNTQSKHLSKLERHNAELEKRVAQAVKVSEEYIEIIKSTGSKESALASQVVQLRGEKLSYEEQIRTLIDNIESEHQTRTALQQSEAYLTSKVTRLEHQIKTLQSTLDAQLATSSQQSDQLLSPSLVVPGPQRDQALLIQQLRQQVDELSTANLALVEENFLLAGAGPAGGQPMDRKNTGKKLAVPPRISSAVKLLDKLPSGGSLDNEIWKGMVAEKKTSEIERLTAENDALRTENMMLRKKSVKG